MADTTTITVRIPVETKEQLDRLAAVTQRSRSMLAAQALTGYVEEELEIVEGVLRGLDDARTGRVTPHEEAMEQLRQRAKRSTNGRSRRTA